MSSMDQGWTEGLVLLVVVLLVVILRGGVPVVLLVVPKVLRVLLVVLLALPEVPVALDCHVLPVWYFRPSFSQSVGPFPVLPFTGKGNPRNDPFGARCVCACV